MTAQERATQAAFKTAEKFGPEEETWPLFARREIAKLRRDAHFEEFMAEIATAPTLETTAHITQQSIDEWHFDKARDHALRAEEDLKARVHGLLGNKRQMIVSRVQYRTELAGEELWVDGPDEFLATADAFLDVMMTADDPNVRVHVTVEWREWPEEKKGADAL